MNPSKKNYGQVKWRVPLLLALLSFISIASAVDYSTYQWATGVSGKLHLGESLSYMEYSVEPVIFPSPAESEKYTSLPADAVMPFVGLNISRNGSFINSTILQTGESFVVPGGELRVTVINLPSKYSPEWLYESYDPWAQVELSPRGKPEPDIYISTNKNEYASSAAAEITADVTTANMGSADLFNVDVIVETDLQIKRGVLRYHYDSVKKGESLTNTIVFSTPILSEIKPYNISARMSGKDVKDISYSAEFLKTISITPEPLKIPTLRKSSNPKIYLRDTAIVTLSLKNNDKYPLKNVSITDSIPENFKLVGNSSLKWIVNLEPYGMWDAHYLIKPLVPFKEGTFLPAANAEFRLRNEYYVVQSDQFEMVVNGPLIVLNKQTDVPEIKPGETVTVTVVAVNSGNTPTQVNVSDELPEGATLVGGNTMHQEYLLAGRELKFSYTIRIDSEVPIVLPPAIADYFELGAKGAKIKAVSNGVGINIKSQTVTPEPTPEPTQVVEVPDNSAAGAVNVSDKPVEPAEPVKKPSSEPVEVNNILKLLLGCDEINGNDSRYYAAQTACNFFNNNTIT